LEITTDDSIKDYEYLQFLEYTADISPQLSYAQAKDKWIFETVISHLEDVDDNGN
jgi:hypothetical protein